MNNIFKDIESDLLCDADKDESLFNEPAIEGIVKNRILTRLETAKTPSHKGFVFEDIAFEFFDYMLIRTSRTQKTKDLGLDGIAYFQVDLLGDIEFGVQVKWSAGTILPSAVNELEGTMKQFGIQFGILVCSKVSGAFKKQFAISEKIRRMITTKFGEETGKKIGRIVEEEIENTQFTPVFVIEFNELVAIAARSMRSALKEIYKR